LRACFLTTSLGSVSRAVADDAWEAWPKKTAEPVIELKPATDANGAAKAWEVWPKKTAEPVSELKPATDANEADKAGIPREENGDGKLLQKRSAGSPSGSPRSSGSRSPPAEVEAETEAVR